MVSLACSKMKPATAYQQTRYLLQRRDCTEKNAINIALWYEKLLTHQLEMKVFHPRFGNRGEPHGRT